jgi:hypothetical protein
MVVILHKSLKQNVLLRKVIQHYSYRSILHPSLRQSLYEKLGTSIIFGKKVDQDELKFFFQLLESLNKN